MRNKFLSTGQSGYHPFRKLKVCLSGLRYAVLYDFSVAYKVIVSVLVLTVCFYFRQWVDFISIFAATGLMPLWPQVLDAAPADAALLLQQAAQRVLEPSCLALGCLKFT